MYVYVIRHAIAVEHGTPGFAEDDRPLTNQGRRKMRRITRALDRLGVRVSDIWTSPLPRARQTADILAEELKGSITVRECDPLRPGGDYRTLIRELAGLDDKQSVALVGHEPDLGEMTSWLLTGRKTGFIRFKKGGVACLDVEGVDPPSGNRLLWLLTPKQMLRSDDE
ncbi:MAG: hypothetical protein AMXMBFR83_13870 [Phycisphaerae bacterium]